MRLKVISSNQSGFGLVEIILACAIFPIIAIGLSNGYDAVRRSYTLAKQLNEMYAVLSACPEIDRALEYDSLTSSANCYPNNTFLAEGGSGNVITYSPNLTVNDTAALPTADPLKAIPDAKVIDITVAYQGSTATPMELRMLITRNGIGQQ